MNLSLLTKEITKAFRLDEMLAKDNVCGLFGSAKSAFIAAVFESSASSVIVAAKNSDEAEHVYEEVKIFLGGQFKNVFFFEADNEKQRCSALSHISTGEKVVIIGSVNSFLQKTYSRKNLLNKIIPLRQGRNYPMRDLAVKLIELGFERAYMAEEEGDISVRGGIIDVFLPGSKCPVRIEFSGDEIESMREFEVASQRSTKKIDRVDIIPVKEEKDSGFFEFFGEKTTVILDEPSQFEGPPLVTASCKKISFSHFPLSENVFEINAELPRDYNARIEDFVKELSAGGGGGERFENFIISKQAARLKELLLEHGVFFGMKIVQGELSHGFVLPNEKIALFTDKEIFGELIPRRRFRIPKESGASQKLTVDFKEGDYVVHKNYGIGIYQGIVSQPVGGIISDYLYIRYALEDRLYVPTYQMHLISKYGVPGEYDPKLSRLGSSDWNHAKKRAKKSIKLLTKELMDIYSSRQKLNTQAFPPDTPWQAEFEQAFPYEETPDQKEAAAALKKDMESGKPMDRLLCGDVGYGKTEVALRAAFKAASFGKQVCVLVPTTILAEQHYKIFCERFAPFPFAVEMLSRFRSHTQQKEIVKKIEGGIVDVIIGTHRVLQKDIKFRDLGLLIVDEEQRFGVAHKEALKKFKRVVDVLTLSATPIPRTLYMALSGIWDMSIIATPPPGRSQISTYVLPWSKKTVHQAIEREVERGGQVFYLHNRVDSIYAAAEKLKRMFPRLKIAVAHGQMDEKALEKGMIGFVERKSDILVCTTIIESGLDIPNVNTIIIEDPQNFGLSTLYQLRGRVGRSNVKAHAYLLYDQGVMFTDKALERLSAIKSFTALGSGQKIAMKDLEIRGAGNVLGAQQHGHMTAIGFDLYCELLKEAAAELKGEKLPAKKEVIIDIKMSAFIPQEYISDEAERIAAYKRINILNSEEEINDLKEEIRDRFGKISQEALNLFSLVDIKIMAAEKGIRKIVQKHNYIYVESDQKKEKVDVANMTADRILKELKRFIERCSRDNS